VTCYFPKQIGGEGKSANGKEQEHRYDLEAKKEEEMDGTTCMNDDDDNNSSSSSLLFPYE